MYSTALFFFIIPSIYLFIRKPRPIKRILYATLLFGLLFSFIFDFVAEFNGAWAWEQSSQLVFNYFILGVVSVDVMIWFFFWIFFIIIFYEHFFEHERSDKISSHFKYAIYPAVFGLIAVLLAFFLRPSLLKFDYAYLVIGLFTLIPFAVLIYRKPPLLIKFFKASAFFIFLYLVFELTAVKIGQWDFPGQYIGHVEILGLGFPFEEFLFWILLSSTVVLSYYELYVDDEK